MNRLKELRIEKVLTKWKLPKGNKKRGGNKSTPIIVYFVFVQFSLVPEQ